VDLKHNNKKDEACRFISAKIKFHCAYLEKEVEVDAAHFAGFEQECDCCGSHGDVTVSVRCECERWHTITLTTW
jgi:hypothetical protein